MRVARIHGYNWMGLRYFDVLIPDGLTRVTGLNESGKTSFILGFLASFLGAKDKNLDWSRPAEMLRHGTIEGEFFCDLDDGTTVGLMMDTKHGVRLSAKDAEGKKLSQGELSEMVSSLGLDPGPLVAQAKTAEGRRRQVELVKGILGKEVCEELDRLAAEEARLVEERKAEGAILDRMGAVVQPDFPEPEAVDVSETSEQLKKATEHNKNVDAAALRRNMAERRSKDATTKVLEAEQALRLARLELEGEMRAFDDAIAACEKLGPRIDTDPMTTALSEAGAVTERRAAWARHRERAEEYAAHVSAKSGLDGKISEVRAAKARVTEDHPLPVPGLVLTDDGIRVADPNAPESTVPLEQVNAQRRAEIFIDLVLADNPKLRAIVLREESPFDPISEARVAAYALERGLQVLLEARGAAEGDNCIRLVEGESVEEDDPRWVAVLEAIEDLKRPKKTSGKPF